MIPNLLNIVLGLALVYCAILAPGWLSPAHWPLLAAGVVVAILAWWARSGDKLKWFNLTNALLGMALALLGVVSLATEVPRLALFWWTFSVGIIVATLAFWSVVYERDGSGRPIQ